MNVTLNSYNLSSSFIRVNRVMHDSSPENILNSIVVPRRDKAKLLSSELAPKKITIEGIITGTDQDNLEINIDAFKKNVYVNEINLDISYASGTRRYVVTPSSIVISRDTNNITFVPFSIELTALDPAGINITQESRTYTGIDPTSYTATVTVQGTLYPEPTITFTITTCTNFTELTMTNRYRSDYLTIPGLFSDGDSIEVNYASRTVKRNTIEHEYTGVFPEFKLDDNTIDLDITASSCNMTMDLDYYPRYL
mgnify:CR=1 FL=1